MVARLKDIIYTRDGKQIVSFSTESDFSDEFDKLKDADVDVEIKKHRKHRSNNANDYCWVLCSLIAKRLSDEKVKHTKNDVYRNAIREIGVYVDYEGLTIQKAKTLRTAWGKMGIGWVTEQVDYSQDGEKVTVRCYYGSSQYNTKQMSRLLDCLIEDCRSLGIPTETPNQIANRLSLWEQEYQKRKEKERWN